MRKSGSLTKMAEEAMLESEISGLHIVGEGHSRQQDKCEEKPWRPKIDGTWDCAVLHL